MNTTSKQEVHDFSYDKRGNLVKESTNNSIIASYIYDATNKMVKGTNEKGESSVYNYNGIAALVNNTTDISKDYVIRPVLKVRNQAYSYYVWHKSRSF